MKSIINFTTTSVSANVNVGTVFNSLQVSPSSATELKDFSTGVLTGLYLYLDEKTADDSGVAWPRNGLGTENASSSPSGFSSAGQDPSFFSSSLASGWAYIKTADHDACITFKGNPNTQYYLSTLQGSTSNTTRVAKLIPFVGTWDSSEYIVSHGNVTTPVATHMRVTTDSNGFARLQIESDESVSSNADYMLISGAVVSDSPIAGSQWFTGAIPFSCTADKQQGTASEIVNLSPLNGTITSASLAGTVLAVNNNAITLPELPSLQASQFNVDYPLVITGSDGNSVTLNFKIVPRLNEQCPEISLPASSNGLLKNSQASLAAGDRLWTRITQGSGTVLPSGDVINHSDPCVIDVAVYDASESGWTNKQTVTLSTGTATNTPPSIDGLTAIGAAQESTSQTQIFTVSSLESGTVSLSDSTYASLSSIGGTYTLTVNLPSYSTAQQISFDVIANDGVNAAVSETITYNVTQAVITPAQVGVRFKLKRPNGQPVSSEQLTALFIDGSSITSSTITTSAQGFVEVTNTPASTLGETLRLALIKDGATINDDEMLIRRVRSVDLNNASARSDA